MVTFFKVGSDSKINPNFDGVYAQGFFSFTSHILEIDNCRLLSEANLIDIINRDDNKIINELKILNCE